MEASNNLRRPRYTRSAQEPLALTPRKLGLLEHVAEFGFISVPQLARLTGDSLKAIRRQMRPLFDAGLVEIIPIPRAALAEATDPNDFTLLGGSAPNIFRLTKAGGKVLTQTLGLEPDRIGYEYGPKNHYFVAHELGVRDVFTWVHCAARYSPSSELLQWHMGDGAWINLNRSGSPGTVRPDAWFTIKVKAGVLCGLVERDQGTERGGRRWTEKMVAYGLLFASDRLKATTGYQNARVLVITATTARRDHLAQFISEQASTDLAKHFWIATNDVLKRDDLEAPLWRQPGSQLLRPLLPALRVSDAATPI